MCCRCCCRRHWRPASVRRKADSSDLLCSCWRLLLLDRATGRQHNGLVLVGRRPSCWRATNGQRECQRLGRAAAVASAAAAAAAAAIYHERRSINGRPTDLTASCARKTPTGDNRRPASALATTAPLRCYLFCRPLQHGQQTTLEQTFPPLPLCSACSVLIYDQPTTSVVRGPLLAREWTSASETMD